MSGNNQSLSKLNKKDLYDVATNLKCENESLQEELDNLKSIFKITGEGEFSPAILDKEYQEMLGKKLHFETKYKELQKKFTPDKDAMMIANKTIDRLTEENHKLLDIEEQYEDTKRKLDKLANTHQRQSKSYSEILNRNLDLEKQVEDLQNSIDTSHLENLENKNKKLLTEIKELRGTAGGSKGRLTSYKNKILEIYGCDIEADYEWKDIFKMIRNTKVLEDTIYEKDEYIKELQDDLKVMEQTEAELRTNISKLKDEVSYYQRKHDLLYEYFNLKK